MIHTMSNLQDGVVKLDNGEYVDFEVPAAYHAIKATQSLGNDWNVFLEKASAAILKSVHEPLSFKNGKENLDYELFDKYINQPNFNTDDINGTLDSYSSLAQRLRIDIEGTKAQPFIFRTPNADEFDKARTSLILIVELFKRIGDNLTDTHNIQGVTMTIREDSKFFDVKIDEINDRAWCGFDCR